MVFWICLQWCIYIVARLRLDYKISGHELQRESSLGGAGLLMLYDYMHVYKHLNSSAPVNQTSIQRSKAGRVIWAVNNVEVMTTSLCLRWVLQENEFGFVLMRCISHHAVA